MRGLVSSTNRACRLLVFRHIDCAESPTESYNFGRMEVPMATAQLIDQAKQEAFVNKVLGDTSATMTTILASIGDLCLPKTPSSDFPTQCNIVTFRLPG